MNNNRPHRPIKLLLINPRFLESFWSFRWWVEDMLESVHRIYRSGIDVFGGFILKGAVGTCIA